MTGRNGNGKGFMPDTSVLELEPDINIPLETLAKKTGNKPEVAGGMIEITPLQIERITVPIIAKTELIMHRWSEKAKRELSGLDEDRKPVQLKKKKDPRDPVADYEGAMYRFEDGGHGFPAAALKAAMVGACRFHDGIAMTLAKQLFFVIGEGPDALIRILGTNYDPECNLRMREDMVRLATGTADIRWRPGYMPWSALVTIEFNANMITRNSIVTLVNSAGFVGIGEWRPSSPKSATGVYGMFKVDTSAAIQHEIPA